MKYIQQFILIMVMLLVACSSSAKVYTEDEKSIGVSAASPDFTIKLKSNPTTGYTWTLQNDSPSIKMNKHGYVSGGEKGLVGAGGFDEWFFSAQPDFFANGDQVKLIFVYKRNWEKAEPAKTIEFTVSAN